MITCKTFWKPEHFDKIPSRNRTAWLNKLKTKLGCSNCGYNKCAHALHFHHLNPENKKFNVSAIKNAQSWKVIEEICGCVVLCANCHIELHKEL
jgi:hypothetical protein